MTTKYTYAIIRYVHDKVTAEFVNVGVLLYAPATGFLQARCATPGTRLRHMFGRVDSDHVREFLCYIERRASQFDRTGQKMATLFDGPAETVATYAARILPPDDSSLQLSPIGGGVTDNPALELESIFERHVNYYLVKSTKSTRGDEDVLPVFRKPLEERRLTAHIQPKIITAPDYEHEFPLAWKNGVWNACDALSFDLKGRADIIEKANKWLGRASNLFESGEKFRLILLIGEPRRPELDEASSTAERILRKADGEVIVIREREAQRLAEMVERDLTY